MTTQDPRSLLVLAFDSSAKAEEALMALSRISTEGKVLLHDAVFLAKDTDGSVRVTETVDPQPADSAVRSGFWGALVGTLLVPGVGTLVGGAVSAGIGALFAKLVDVGIPDATVKELETAIEPGWTALALLVSHVDEDGLTKELARFSGARLVQSTLAAGTVQELRNALRAKDEH